MIRNHDFNSRWWGSPVGIVDEPTFFDLPPRAQDEVCAPYAWVEYAAPLDAAPSPERISSAGFHWVDTQIPFRIALARLESTPSIALLSANSASEVPFGVATGDVKSFIHERYRLLPGASAERLNQRYALWSNLLIQEEPDWCLRIMERSHVQGWFLAKALSGRTINLTLAMLHRDAKISGLLLYQKAMLEYAARGMQLGSATFSVSNTPVMNIYSSLGARFLAPRVHWLRWAADSGGRVS